MLFNSLPFALFFVLLYTLVLATPKRFEASLLLSASLLFYTLWHPAYLLLLGVTVVVNYGFLRLIVQNRVDSGGSARSRALLLGSAGFSIGLLGWFKYSALTMETLAPLITALFGLEVELPDFFLPLGISFYSFQILAMNFDAHRGQVDEVPSFGRYLLFICFFPQLIAGPIVRSHELLPQLAAGGQRTRERTREGLGLICLGAFKKVVMGDFFLSSFVASVFVEPGTQTAGAHLIGMYAFAFQIYFDFSGYTDIARGLALLLGFQLPENFREPYLAVNPNDFWRRWHITLSNWFRDYVYISLGGSRNGNGRTYMNLAAVFLLSGLWHGASWHFVAWGLYHVALHSLHRLLGPLLARVTPRSSVSRWIWGGVRWFVMIHLVAFGWILFRADSVADAWTYFAHMLSGDFLHGIPATETALIAISLAFHLVESWRRRNAEQIRSVLDRSRWGTLAEGAAMGAAAALTLAAMGAGGEFIYFQF